MPAASKSRLATGATGRGSQLEALAGEYADPAEPSDGYTLLLQDGKLIVESDRAGAHRAQAHLGNRLQPAGFR